MGEKGVLWTTLGLLGLIAIATGASLRRRISLHNKLVSDMRTFADRERRKRRINRVLEGAGLRAPPQVDDVQYCIKAAASIVRIILRKAGSTTHELDDKGKFAAGIFGFVASDYLSSALGQPYEAVSSVVPIDLFGAEYADQMLHLREAYDWLAQQSGVIKIIGENIAGWAANPSPARLTRLAELFKLCRRHL